MFSEQNAGGCDIELGSTHQTSHLQFPASDFKYLNSFAVEAFCDFQYRSDKTRLFANFDILIQEKV